MEISKNSKNLKCLKSLKNLQNVNNLKNLKHLKNFKNLKKENVDRVKQFEQLGKIEKNGTQRAARRDPPAESGSNARPINARVRAQAPTTPTPAGHARRDDERSVRVRTCRFSADRRLHIARG